MMDLISYHTIAGCVYEIAKEVFNHRNGSNLKL